MQFAYGKLQHTNVLVKQKKEKTFMQIKKFCGSPVYVDDLYREIKPERMQTKRENIWKSREHF